MYRVAVAMFLIAAFVLQAAGQGGRSERASKDRTPRERVIASVERALDSLGDEQGGVAAPSRTGARLVGAEVRTKQKEIVLNFSSELLNYDLEGRLEPVLDHLLEGAGETVPDWKEVNYKILIEGTPLSEYLAPVDQQAIEQVAAESPKGTGKVEALAASGKPVVISPGHGWYWHEGFRSWQLQRGYFWGIVEDFVNSEMVMLLNSELASTGLDVRSTRNLNKRAGNGVTGHPKWEESARYHLQAVGAPQSVWASASSDMDKDLRSRPLYANWVGGGLLVSLHNNGGKGSGTETWYDSANGQQGESRKLATVINDKIVGALRQQYNRNWPNRGLKSCDGCKGENRLAKMPAVIVEVAFMDTKSPDNDALRDERFRQIVARAIRDGVAEYLGVRTQPSGDFAVGAGPASLTITRGQSASFSLAVQSKNNFNGQVNLYALNLPGNQVLRGTGWSPQSVRPPVNGTAFSTFTFVSNNSTPTGTFDITLRGSSGGQNRDARVRLTINPPQSSADQQAQKDITDRASRDRRFGSVISNTFGKDLNWEPDWELRWMAFNFSGGRTIIVYHARNKSSSNRYTNYIDPATGNWVSWELAR